MIMSSKTKTPGKRKVIIYIYYNNNNNNDKQINRMISLKVVPFLLPRNSQLEEAGEARPRVQGAEVKNSPFVHFFGFVS